MCVGAGVSAYLCSGVECVCVCVLAVECLSLYTRVVWVRVKFVSVCVGTLSVYVFGIVALWKV